jgi:hypothetical protein
MKAVAVFPESRAVRIIDDHPDLGIELPTRVKLREFSRKLPPA